MRDSREILLDLFLFILVIYRSNDYAWNDHPNVSNQPVRAASPIKAKYSTSARHLANGILHEGTTNSMLHLPTTSSTTPIVHQEINNGNLNLSSATKSRLPIRLNRTNSHLDKASGPNNYGLPMRSDSYRSSRVDYGLRPRHTSSKQRNYVASKTSSHDVNADSTQDENVYHQQPVNVISSTQRLNGSSFDLNASRKIFSPNKTNSFNITAHHNYFSSTQELHHIGATADRNYSTRFVNRDTTSKEQLLTTQKYRQTTTTTPAVTFTNPIAVTQTNERHPSAQSYKSRDPNISYAYTDVKKYIEENELMSQEKEQTIRNWIIDVEKYRHQLQKIE
jgi:hypothetical protein